MKNTLLMSVALAAVLTAPAFAQDHSDHRQGHAPNGQAIGGPAGHGGAPQHQAPAAAPAAPAARQNDGQFHWNDSSRGNDNRGGPAMRRDNNHGNNPGNNDRHDNNRGPDNNRNNNWNGNNRGPGMQGHNDFRSYNRNFRAPRRFHAPNYHRPSGWYYRRWTFGQTLPSLFWSQQYWLNDYYAYDLPPPPPGAVWVRYGNDALLIDRYSGEIIQVEYDAFY